MRNKYRKYAPITIILVAFTIGFIGLWTKTIGYITSANAQGMRTIFGGSITEVKYCCDGSVLITIQQPKGGTFLFSPGQSTLYNYFMVWMPGPNVIGDANPGGSCDTASSECEDSESGDTINQIGTSTF